MDRQLIISDSAKLQIENAIDYIAFTLNNLTAAESVLNDIEETYNEIISMPEAMPFCSDPVLLKNGYHKALMKNHDYIILFKIDGNNIKVSGFFHTLENYASKI